MNFRAPIILRPTHTNVRFPCSGRSDPHTEHMPRRREGDTSVTSVTNNICSEGICATTGSGDAAARRRGRCARRRRFRGRGCADLRDDGCQRVRCCCGGCRASARRPASSCSCSTHGRAGQRAACNMHVRVPASVRALARGPPPGTGVGEAHTRLADDPLAPAHGQQTRCCVCPTDYPLGPARGQQTRCVRTRQAAHLVFSLSDVNEGGPRLQAATDRAACVAAPQQHQPPPPATRHSPQGAAPRHGEGGQRRRRTAAPRHTAGCGLCPQCVFFYPTLEPA